MNLTPARALALSALLLTASACEAESDDAILIELTKLTPTAMGTCVVDYTIQNNTKNRLTKFVVSMNWTKPDDDGGGYFDTVISAENLPPKEKKMQKNSIALPDGGECAKLPEPWVSRWHDCKLENVPEGDCQDAVVVRASY
ncbi:MAG: hypothetical protein R8L07_10965 [Alphaproteobacteria bacterium]|nr:hypothetical protein [Alphaproteobacteria bacterium]